MLLNIFSLTISITKQKIPTSKALQNEQVKKIFEENKRKAEKYTRVRHY